MSGDLPSEFWWISKRLTRKIVDDRSAPRGAWKLSKKTLGLPSVPGVPKGEWEFVPHEPVTPQDHAVHATRLLEASPGVGTLDQPGEYVRMTLNFHMAEIEILRGSDGPRRFRAATLFARGYVGGVGRVFVALFGSRHNILDHDRPEEYVSGPVPSDALGLYQLLHSVREPEDLQVSSSLLHHAAETDCEPLSRAASAALIIFGLSEPTIARPTEVLAQLHIEPVRGQKRPVRQYGDTDPGRYDLILLGTAIWAGKPGALPPPYLASDVTFERRAVWDYLEEEVDRQAVGARSGGFLHVPQELQQPDEAVWRHYASWFVDWARRSGQIEMTMEASPEPPGLLSRIFRSREEQPPFVLTPFKGVFISGKSLRSAWGGRGDQDRGLLLTDDGSLFPVMLFRRGTSGLLFSAGTEEPRCLYWPEHGQPKWGPQPHPRPGEAVEVERAARRDMWRLAVHWRRRLYTHEAWRPDFEDEE
jgi:hypothetical protein